MFLASGACGWSLGVQGVVDFLCVASEEGWSLLGTAARGAGDASVGEWVDTLQYQGLHVVSHTWWNDFANSAIRQIHTLKPKCVRRDREGTAESKIYTGTPARYKDEL